MNRIRKIARPLLSLVLAVLVLEVCARIDDYVSYGAPMLGVYNSESLYQMDALGKRGKPNASYKKWRLNSLGYRGPELHAGTVRVVCLGASETFGLYEADGHEYPRLLEHYLNDRVGDAKTEIVNSAYPGASVRTATARVPEIVAAVHPQFAVIQPSVANYIWLPWVTHSTPPPTAMAEPVFEWRIGESVHNLLKQTLPEDLQNWLRGQEIRRDAPQYGKVMDRVPEENVQLLQSDLRTLIHQLRAHSVEPVLVTHASRLHQPLSEADRHLLVSWRKFYPMLKEDGFLDMEARMNQAIRDVAAGEQVQLIDLARQVPASPAYFADYEHFTDAGADFVATTLARELRPAVIAANSARAPLPTDAVAPAALVQTAAQRDAHSVPAAAVTPAVRR